MINQFSNPWWEYALVISLYGSHASKSNSSSICMKQVIWFLNYAILLGGKYLSRNDFFNSFHVVIEFDGRDCCHARALPLREKGNIINWMDSGSTPLLFCVSTNCMKMERCKFGSSIGILENWFCCTIWNMEDFNSKLLAWIAWLTILEWGSSLKGTTNSLSGRLSFSVISCWICWILHRTCKKCAI